MINKSREQIIKDIFSTLDEIDYECPLMRSLLDETPVTIPNVKDPHVTVEDLENYHNELREMISHYEEVKEKA